MKDKPVSVEATNEKYVIVQVMGRAAIGAPSLIQVTTVWSRDGRRRGNFESYLN